MENKYTAEDVEKRTSDLICFDCGKMFLTEKQALDGGAVTAQLAKCGLCEEKKMVTNYRTFNWLIVKDLREREGFKNRHTEPLPDKACEVNIIHKDFNGETIFHCQWTPVDWSKYTGKTMNSGNTYWIDMPGEGYLGSVKVIEGKYKGIGFNAWGQTNGEFIYYKVIY